MKASNIIALIVVLIILSLLIIYVVLPCCYIILKLILKIVKPIVFNIKYKKNKYVPNYKYNFKNYPYTSEVSTVICGFSGNESIRKLHGLPTYSDYVKKFNITSDYAKIYSFNDSRSCDKASCVLYSATHKNDYFKYLVTINRKNNQLYINTYIFGKSKNCSFQDFQNELSKITFLPTFNLYKTSYSSKKEEELYFYKALNEHLKIVIPLITRLDY